MEIQLFQKGLTKEEEASFNEHVNQKIESIQNLLRDVTKDAKALKISIERFQKHDAYEVEFCLNIPNKSIMAKEASHSIQKAVEFANKRLVEQIKKHMAINRRGRAHQGLRRSIREMELKTAEELILEKL